MTKVKTLKLTLVRSISGRLPKHKATIATLGLRRIRQTIEIKDTPAGRGMINQVGYLLKVEEV